jgi:hypothetical protein
VSVWRLGSIQQHVTGKDIYGDLVTFDPGKTKEMLQDALNMYFLVPYCFSFLNPMPVTSI